MKLSELVQLREHLQSIYSTDSIAHEVDLANFNLLSVRNETSGEDFKNQISKLAENIKTVHPILQHNKTIYKTIIDNVNQEIAKVSGKFFSGNYELELKVEHEAVDRIRSIRVLDINESLQTEIESRIALHSSWEYPGLEIGCRDGEWTKFLVSNDPLYIVDQYPDFIESTLENFTEEYQSRLRPYIIKDHNMDALPQGQMAFVFCWNFLNYRSLDTVKEYLKSVKELLRPGGTFMFSYNNGDIPQAAGYAEVWWMSYIPKSMLLPMCESLGFEVTYSRDSHSTGTAISWLELRKPGRLSTVKAHQVLGEIKEINY